MLFELLVRKFCKLNASNDVAVSVCLIVPQTNLATDFFCGSRSVAGYNLDFYTGIGYFFNSVRYIQTDRIRNGNNTKESKISSYNLTFGNCNIFVAKFLIS